MAEAEKIKGNDEFKKGNYEAALQHYNTAISIDPNEVIFYTNKATALTKLNRYDEAIEACNSGISVGREHGTSYENIAKCYNKIASVETLRNNLDAAIEALNSSVLEKNDPTVKRELKRLTDLNTKKKAKEYENPELSDKARLEGNEFFKKSDFPKAIECYTEAIKRAPQNPVNYSNRAAAYTKLFEMPSALADLDKAIDIDPKFVRAYTRKGLCHYQMKEYHKAIDNYKKALELDPNNQDAIDNLKLVQDAVAQQQMSGPDDEQVRRAMADPEIQKILSDPGMQQILKDCQENPAAAASHLQDPKVREAISKLMASGVLRTK